MNTHKKPVQKKFAFTFFAVLCFSLDNTQVFAAPPAPSLQIVSPNSGIVVYRGDMLSLDVTSTPDGSFPGGVGIWAKDIVGLIEGPQSTYHFDIKIPDDASIGARNVTAEGKRQSGEFVQSNEIIVSIERPDNPSGLAVDPNEVQFKRVDGYLRPISVIGMYTDGGKHISASSFTTSTSDNVDVAIIKENTWLIATGPGTANIHFTHKNLSADVHVTVAQNARGDFNGDGKVDMDDLNMLNAVLNTPALGKNDPRDLNQDGQINSQDVSLLKKLCIYKNCATQP